MSESAKALLVAAGIGILILVGPLALLAADLVDVGAMLALQAGALLALYVAAVVIRNRREGG
jgi:threonine/homoserine efflux transporter RhtA